ncbi:MAG TPA: hypothetical protein VFG20_03970 [Planctomycetaceae bacterium]|nr:hypothetical protein [Planctomycetaceae bacterium]
MDPIPDDVLRFLESMVDSIGQLELLRVLSEDRSRERRDDEIAVQIQSTLAVTLSEMAALEARGLLRSARRDGAVYGRLSPHTPELDGQLSRLLDYYRQRPVTIIRMVHERKQNALQDFSDAFKLRKEN